MAINDQNQRRSIINLYSFLTTIVILFIAIEISNGNLAVRITKISENLDRALTEVLSESKPTFTNITTNNVTYVSQINFNPRGMAGLYNLTMAFINIIIPKDIYPEGVLKIVNNRPVLGNLDDEWQGLVIKYVGILTMLIILLLIIVLMPFCGLCFCCCRCCGKCGARSQPFDKKHDLCKKIILATLLIGLGTLLLFGVVCAFVSNEQIQEGVDDLTDNLKDNAKDIITYLDTTKQQVHVLLNVNYREFEEVLLTTMDASNNIVYDQLANYSNAISMTELANVVTKLPDIRKGFDTLKYSTNSLRVYASQLNDAVRKVKKDLLGTLQSCDLPKCAEINKNIGHLQTNIHFNSLPDISDKIDILERLPQQSLEDAVTNGQKSLENVKTRIGETVNSTLLEAKSRINDAGIQIKYGSNNITNMINDLKRKINDNTQPALRQGGDYIKQYGPYRYWIGLGISCLLLLISLCITLGLICGICGKRPDVYGDDCCNKGAGSQFLICGVMLMFFCGFIIACAILISFLIGATSQRILCEPLNDPEHSQVFRIIDQLDLTNYYINFNISQALKKCHQNETIYNVFNLTNQFNLDEVSHYLDKFNIKEILNNLDTSTIDFGQNFEILSNDDKEMLKSLIDNAEFANVDFDQFKSILEDNFTTASFKDLSNELGNLINEIDQQQSDIITDLQLSKMNIDTYQEKIVEPMIQNATAVVELAEDLEHDLKLGHDSFQQAIKSLLDEVNEAERVLTTSGKEVLKGIAENFTTGIVNQIQTYLDRVVVLTQHDLGKCGPLSLVINSTVSSTCDKIILPWNGFWFGLLWSLLLFIPTIIVSVKLATLYQKFSPYSGHLVEAEYLYDAYAERDNIPLNGSRNGKMKKKNKKHKRYEDRPVPQTSGGDVMARDYPSSSHPPDARYADMAPKHWEEFPNGGPPQYQRAPTEYERPPPYYYPAAGENQ